MTDLDQQLTHEVAGGQPVSSAKQQDVAGCCARRRGDTAPGRIIQELGNRRLQAFEPGIRIIDLDPGQAFGAIAGDISRIFIDLLA